MDFDSLPNDAATPATPTPAPAGTPTQNTQPPVSFDSLKDDSETYGTPGQQAIAGLEGVGRGLLGPLATGAERIFDVPAQDILARQKANPWTAGIGEAAGLTGGLLTGTGEAALMTKAGELGVEGLGLATKAGEAGRTVRFR